VGADTLELLPPVEVSLLEATVDDTTGKLTLTVIEAGLNTSETVMYPAEVLERDAQVFAGVKMFLNHATMDEEFLRPEGDLNAWVATLDKVWWDPASNTIKGSATIIDPPFDAKMRMLKERGNLAEMGVSIRAMGKGERKEVEGLEHKVMMISSIEAARSVDFVTSPGAGGKVEMLEKNLLEHLSADVIRKQRPDLVAELQEGGGKVGEQQLDLSELTIETLKEGRPDLVEALSTVKADEVSTLVQKRQAQQIDELTEQNSSLSERLTAALERGSAGDQRIKELREQLDTSEKRNRREDVAKKLDEALEVMNFPTITEKRIRERFRDAESPEGIAEAIRQERDYLTELRGGGIVRDLGGTRDDEATIEESLEDAFKGLGFGDDAAKVAAEGRS